ncbi:hypothetical protein MNV49_005129 [Pseudohyphozyma bogoriensis]|nr:hypothetical protein MNV49_005129 [Pseudohyphozyma bogoriensis]
MVHLPSIIAALALLAPLVAAGGTATTASPRRKATPTPVAPTFDLPEPAEAEALFHHAFGRHVKPAVDFHDTRSHHGAHVRRRPRHKVNATKVTTALEKRVTSRATCLGTGTTGYQITQLFYYGGAGTIVSLCPGAQISLEQTITMFAANQELSTQGYPTDGTRALLTVVGSSSNTAMAGAIYGICTGCNNITVRSIQVNGNRPALGFVSGGNALLEMGGNSAGQVVRDCHLYEPRGWSCLHGFEGDNACASMLFQNNQVGPSGNSPNNGAQFVKRDTTIYSPGQWADGISMACRNSTVQGNTITDATDGGIVVFQAPGSLIHNNTIISNTRHLLGAINAVDYVPYNGTFTGTVVTGNTINAYSTFIKVGIAIGSQIWSTVDTSSYHTYDGVFSGNTFTSGPTGYFGYAIGISGHDHAIVIDNDASTANFGGQRSASCLGNRLTPNPQAFVYDATRTSKLTLQNNFVSHQSAFLICNEPGPILRTGPRTPLDTSKFAQNYDSLPSTCQGTCGLTPTAAARKLSLAQERSLQRKVDWTIF